MLIFKQILPPGSALVRRFLAAILLVSSVALTPVAGLAESRDIVINEVMYNPPGESDTLQFIELFNRGDSAVAMDAWQLAKGVKFTFPAGTKLGAKSYLVVSADRAAYVGHYGGDGVVFGNFTGHLSHRSERIELRDAQQAVVDTFKYEDSGDWPAGPDGYACSLERICPWEDADRPGNWASSAWPATKRAAGTPGRQNSTFATNFPPLVATVKHSPQSPGPNQAVRVTAEVQDQDGVGSVTLLYRVAGTGREGEEQSVPMTRLSGDGRAGLYQGEIHGQPQGQLVRFRIKAVDAVGTERLQPGANEPRPAYSYFTYTNAAPAKIAVGAMVNIGPAGRGTGHYQPTPNRRPQNATTANLRGNGAFLYAPADGSEVLTFDFVRIVRRHGGYKVHFQKDHALKGMTSINLISEGPMRWILAEPLAYVVYRMAGVPSPLTEHVRLSSDGRALGFHLLVEQPNDGFLARNGRDEAGNLYKLLWYGRGVVGQHEKKNHPTTGHDDLVQLIDGLRRNSGSGQWRYIEQNFNVDECVNYYAVNMCIQNWDGFFNNYFTFHDTAGTGKWEIYPWDEDKTWGDYDGASPRYDWYEMPLTFGMNGDSPPRRFTGGGPYGGPGWWRPPGYFSGPLLANPEFRKRFLARLQELCSSVFTEEQLFPIIDAMEQRLEPELRLRAQSTGQDPGRALREFKGYMQSFRAQVQNRRKFILNELRK